MEHLLRIGQVCKLYGISLDTLRHYDRIGLLKPLVTEASGYRYYSFEQLDLLDLILVGRFLGISLENIQKRLVSEKIEDYMLLVKEQQEAIAKKKKALLQLESHADQMTGFLQEIASHRNDDTLQNISYETLEQTIYQIPLAAFPPAGFAGNDTGSFLGTEQWSFYQSDAKGTVTGLPAHVAISLPPSQRTVHTHPDAKIIEIAGTYRVTKFWGKTGELLAYLNRICLHFQLYSAELLVKYLFALAHEDLDNDYFVEIYFPQR